MKRSRKRRRLSIAQLVSAMVFLVACMIGIVTMVAMNQENNQLIPTKSRLALNVTRTVQLDRADEFDPLFIENPRQIPDLESLTYTRLPMTTDEINQRLRESAATFSGIELDYVVRSRFHQRRQPLHYRVYNASIANPFMRIQEENFFNESDDIFYAQYYYQDAKSIAENQPRVQVDDEGQVHQRMALTFTQPNPVSLGYQGDLTNVASPIDGNRPYTFGQVNLISPSLEKTAYQVNEVPNLWVVEIGRDLVTTQDVFRDYELRRGTTRYWLDRDRDNRWVYREIISQVRDTTNMRAPVRYLLKKETAHTSGFEQVNDTWIAKRVTVEETLDDTLMKSVDYAITDMSSLAPDTAFQQDIEQILAEKDDHDATLAQQRESAFQSQPQAFSLTSMETMFEAPAAHVEVLQQMETSDPWPEYTLAQVVDASPEVWFDRLRGVDQQLTGYTITEEQRALRKKVQSATQSIFVNRGFPDPRITTMEDNALQIQFTTHSSTGNSQPYTSTNNLYWDELAFQTVPTPWLMEFPSTRPQWMHLPFYDPSNTFSDFGRGLSTYKGYVVALYSVEENENLHVLEFAYPVELEQYRTRFWLDATKDYCVVRIEQFRGRESYQSSVPDVVISNLQFQEVGGIWIPLAKVRIDFDDNRNWEYASASVIQSVTTIESATALFTREE